MGENSDVAKGCLFPAAIITLIGAAWWLALVPLNIWHKTGADGHQHPVTATYVAYLIGAVAIVAPLMFFSIRSANRRQAAVRRAAPASGPPMTSLPPTAAETRRAAPPICLHLGAVKVDSSVQEGLIWCCWCPDCGAELPANWRRLCCGSEPEAAHVYNCPQASRR